MRSELSFLMDLFLNDEVPQPIKKMVADRIREVEEALINPPVQTWTSNVASMGHLPPVPTIPHAGQQAPSMQRIIDANPDVVAPPVTQAAAIALQKRAQLVMSAQAEKPEPGRTSPRKF